MYNTIQAAKNKGANQIAWMRRLICAFVVCIWHKQVFSCCGSWPATGDIRHRGLDVHVYGPRQANLVLIAYASSEGSGEPAHPRSRQNLRCSLIQAMSQEEPSDRNPDHWPLWMGGHAQLKFVMTECSKTQIRLTGLIYKPYFYHMTD